MGGIILHIASVDVPDGRAAVPVHLADAAGNRQLLLSHLGIVLLAAAHQRGDGSLVPPLNLHAAMSDRIAEEVGLLVRLGLAEENGAGAIRISPAGRAVLDAIENED